MNWCQTGDISLPEPTRTTRTPSFWWYHPPTPHTHPPPPHDYPYYWVTLDPKSKEDKVKVTNLKNSPKFQFFQFWNKHYTRYTISSCLIRCANMIDNHESNKGYKWLHEGVNEFNCRLNPSRIKLCGLGLLRCMVSMKAISHINSVEPGQIATIFIS